MWDKAVVYCRQAGAMAMCRSAYREAVTYFEQALEALQHLPVGLDTQAQAIDLRLELRNALYPLGEIERILVSLQDAAALAEALGDQHRLGWVSAYLLNHFVLAAEPDHALASGQRALAIGVALGDVSLTAVVQNYLGFVYRSLGDYRQAAEYFRKNMVLLHDALLYECLGLPGLASVHSLGGLTHVLAECGAFVEGRMAAEEGVRIADTADHPYSRVHAYWATGFLWLRKGDLHQAIPVFERLHDLVQGAHLQLWVPRVASGPRPGRGAEHAPAPGPLPPRPRYAVYQDRAAGAGAHRTVCRYWPVPCHGDDVLAAPGGGSTGGGSLRDKGCVKRDLSLNDSIMAGTPAPQCDRLQHQQGPQV